MFDFEPLDGGVTRRAKSLSRVEKKVGDDAEEGSQSKRVGPPSVCSGDSLTRHGVRMRHGCRIVALLCVLIMLVWSEDTQDIGALHHASRTDHLSSQLSASFLDCMRDLGRHLPIRKNDGQLVAHHYLAGRPEWNEDIRFAPFGATLPNSPLILDIGGNTRAADSRKFLKMFPNATIHIYEPVPPFFNELRRNWQEVRGQVFFHAVGFGMSNQTVDISPNDLDGEGTFIMDPVNKLHSKDNTTMALKIVDAQAELLTYLNLGDNALQRQKIDLLHMNCEGCEWGALMRLVVTDMLHYVGILQVSFHNYGTEGIGNLLPQYCLIREALEKTHHKVVAMPFAWERWVHKEKADWKENAD